MKKCVSVYLTILLLAGVSFAATKSSISQFGITWTFDKTYECGQFVSGDWWVKGPVTVKSVSPAPSGSRNGSMINPRGGSQAYDSRGTQYSGGQGVTFPRVIQPVSSLVSSKSKGGGTDWQEFKNVGCLQSQAVLTVVSSTPAAGSFRPAYAGTYKTIFNTGQIIWPRLPTVPAVANMPEGSSVMRPFERPRIDHNTNWGIQYSCAQDNFLNCYGREVGNYVAGAAMYLMINTPERTELAYRMIQHGIDCYGVLKAGGGWPKDMDNPGGHFNGRKFPILFAGVMLGDAGITNFDKEFTNELLFQEDLQVYRGNNGKALWGSPCTGTYFSSGCSGSGSKDCRDPAGLRDGCGSYRICCTSKTWVGQALAVLMMHAKEVWNYDVWFEYVDRWVVEREAVESNDSYIFGSTLVKNMWKAYRNNLPDAVEIVPDHAIALPPNFNIKDINNASAVVGIEENCDFSITIYNILGQTIWSYSKLNAQVGCHRIKYDKVNIGDGIYFAILKRSDKRIAKMFLIMK